MTLDPYILILKSIIKSVAEVLALSLNSLSFYGLVSLQGCKAWIHKWLEFRLKSLNMKTVLRLEFDFDALTLQLLFLETSLPLFFDPSHVLSRAICCLVESGPDLCNFLPLSLNASRCLFFSLLALLNDFLILSELLFILSHFLHNYLALLPLQLFPILIESLQ